MSRLIEQLLRANQATLDMGEVKHYFQLFERTGLLDELLAETNDQAG